MAGRPIKRKFTAEDVANNIFTFCEASYNLVPQPIKPEYKDVDIDDWEAYMFGTPTEVTVTEDYEDAYYIKYDWYDYKKKLVYNKKTKDVQGHLTWQQVQILHQIQKQIDRGEKIKLHLLVLSGTGIGKTMIISLISNFLYLRNNYTGGMVTSPSAGTSSDGLWKELNIWLNRVPESIRRLATGDEVYSITGFIKRDGDENHHSISRRNIEKGRTGSIAGFHAPFVFKIVDEATDVDDPIIREMQVGLTDDEYVFILITNPRVYTGRTFVKNIYDNWKEGVDDGWTVFQYSGEESPNTREEHAKATLMSCLREGGREAFSYKMAVRGQYTDDNTDTDGWIPLIPDKLLKEACVPFEPEATEQTFQYAGVDPSDGGGDATAIVVRNKTHALLDFSSVMRGHSIQQQIAGHMYSAFKKRGARYMTVDNFGVGAKTMEVYLKQYNHLIKKVGRDQNVRGISVGDSKLRYNKRKFSNKRADLSWTLREWLMQGGKLIGSYHAWKELLSIYYRRTVGDKIEIMTKKQMKKMGIRSPNRYDALMLSFFQQDKSEIFIEEEVKKRKDTNPFKEMVEFESNPDSLYNSLI